MRARSLILVAGLLPAFAAISLAQEAPATAPTPPPQTEAEKAALLDLVLANQKKNDEAMNLYERVERVEMRKNALDKQTGEIKVSRVVPAGTGVDHIPIGPDGKPSDPDVYHAELLKLERALSWAADDGHAQHDLGQPGGNPADLSQLAPHGNRRGAGPACVLGAVEPHRQRVTAELQQRAAVTAGDDQQLGEAEVDGVDELLGSLRADPGQPLGQPGEPGHVGEGHRALERLDPLLGRRGQTPKQEKGQVGLVCPGMGVHLN